MNDLISDKITALKSSHVILIENTNYHHWERRRVFTHKIISYSYRNFLNKYEWYLKFDNADKLVFPDHFAKLVYHKTETTDRDDIHKFDLNLPWILGHFIEFSPCLHFIYSLAVYGINNKFIEIVGKIAIKDDVFSVKDLAECADDFTSCNHHHESDYPWACLEDLDIKIAPIRDEYDRDYFFPFQVKDHYVKMNEYKKDDWYWFGKNKESVGDNCCAKYPVAFSNYPDDPELLLKYYQIVYSAKPRARTIKLMARVRYMDLPPNVTQIGSSLKPH